MWGSGFESLGNFSDFEKPSVRKAADGFESFEYEDDGKLGVKSIQIGQVEKGSQSAHPVTFKSEDSQLSVTSVKSGESNARSMTYCTVSRKWKLEGS